MMKTRVPLERITDKMQSFMDDLEEYGFISYRVIRGVVVIKWRDRFAKCLNSMGFHNFSFEGFSFSEYESDMTPSPVTLSPYSPPAPTSPPPIITSSSITSAHFDEWYGMYPRKVNRAYAKKCWEKTVPKFAEHSMDWPALEACTQLYVESWEDTPKDKIPHPSTWLNQLRWTEPPENLPQAKLTSTPKHAKIVELLKDVLERMTGISQTKRDKDVLYQVADSMLVAMTALSTAPEVTYHTVSDLGMARRYCDFLEQQYRGFLGLTAGMLGPGHKSWERFILAFQQSIGMSLTTGGMIHCAGEKWIMLLNGKS